MTGSLQNIRDELRRGSYKNEQQVRVSLIIRLLQELGWDIWNPQEVYTEYSATPNEDKTKVDFALFCKEEPHIFIEAKAPGKIDEKLAETEKQLRDYNKDMTVSICVITDGRKWRFYLSTEKGSFGEKCFKVVDLLEDAPQESENVLRTYLSKEAVSSGSAEKQAKVAHEAKIRLKIVEGCLEEAYQELKKTPSDTLANVVWGLAKEKDRSLSLEEVKELIPQADRHRKSASALSARSTGTTDGQPGSMIVEKSPTDVGDLTHTKVLRASIGQESAKDWASLVRTAVKIAMKRGKTLEQLRPFVNLKEGVVVTKDDKKKGFQPVPEMKVSVQNVQVDRAYDILLKLAKELNLVLDITWLWQNKEGAAHPGKTGHAHYAP